MKLRYIASLVVLSFLVIGCGGGGGGGSAGPVSSSTSSSSPSSSSESSSSESSVSQSSSSSIANLAPVANAGADFSVVELSEAVLDGSLSHDDGQIITYSWVQIGGEEATLSNADSANATFVAPDIGIATTIIFELTVSDENGLSSTDSVHIVVTHIENAPPVADAGPDKLANPNTTVALTGGNSYDPDGDLHIYEWELISGPAVEIARSTAAFAEFVPLSEGEYVFQLTVQDSLLVRSSDTVVITVVSDNALPVIDVSDNVYRVFETEVATISNISVTDSDGTIASYAWSVVDSTVDIELVNADQLVPSFATPEVSEAESVTLSLAVTDDRGAEVTSIPIFVTIELVTVAPQANAGNAQVVSSGSTVMLDGSGSTDADGIVAKYAWSQSHGSPVDLMNAAGATPQFTAPAIDGLVVLELEVTDNHGNTDTDYVHIQVTSGLGLKTQRKVDPARLQLIWNDDVDADQFNLYYAKNSAVNSGNYASVEGSVAVLGVSTPLELDATFNEYQNTHFTIEAVKDGEIVLTDTRETRIDSIAVNGGGGCTIEGGSVNCWGLLTEELNVNQLINPRQVSIGYDHTCALDDTGVVCWGGNIWGQTDVPPLTNPRYIHAEGAISCALDDTGYVCWGFGGSSVGLPQLENAIAVTEVCILNDTEVACNNRIAAPPVLNNPRALSVSRSASRSACALDANGVSCWGSNDGITEVPLLNDPVAIAVGWSHACALQSNGDVVCWGDGSAAQIGAPELVNPRQIVAGTGFTCALDDLGLQCWGNTYDSLAGETDIDKVELGEGICVQSGTDLECLPSTGARTPATDVNTFAFSLHRCVLSLAGELTCSLLIDDVPELTNVELFDVASGYACAKSAEGIQCWGAEADSLQMTSSYPAVTDIVALEAGDMFACVMNDSTVECWGDPYSAGLNVPVVSAPTALSVSNTAACVIDSGEVKCWGRNNYFGELSPPVFDNATAISLGHAHGCAIAGGNVDCWGRDSGETYVPVLYNPRQIEAGNSSTCSIDDFGLICWGVNAFGGFGWRANPRF